MKTAQDTPGTSATKTKFLFGEFLVSKGLLSRRELIEVLNEQRRHGGRLGEALLRLKMLKDEDVTCALAEYLSMDYIHFDDVAKIDMNIARILPESIAKRFCLVAIGEIDNKVIVAMADPLNVIAIDTITLKIKRQIKVVISSPREIHQAIEVIYHGSDVEEQHLRDLVELEISTEDSQEDLFEDATETDISGEVAATKAPVIRFVDLLLSQAIKSRASDIHIEPQEHSMIIRMRIDGVLRD
ncbi:hypothetical protein LCGC14_3041870, partial [marine sediment metagenome]